MVFFFLKLHIESFWLRSYKEKLNRQKKNENQEKSNKIYNYPSQLEDGLEATNLLRCGGRRKVWSHFVRDIWFSPEK